MAVRYKLTDHMVPVPADYADQDGASAVLVLNREEFDALTFLAPTVQDELDVLEEAEINYVEIMSDYLIGSFAIPDRSNLTSVSPDLISFYLDCSHLIFIDDGTLAATVLNNLEKTGILHKVTVGHCLAMFFRLLLQDDLIFLGDLEDSMEQLEEALLERDQEITTRQIVDYRRFCMRMSAYYQQIATMAQLIADNENQLIDEEDMHAFERVSRQADRLVSRAETIESYSTQLRELYQTQIDLKQNSIMQLFTIVTVLFVPMTLVTGWFGMNLAYLPGLDWPFMVPFLLIMAAVLLVFLLSFFHHKRWI